MKVPGISSVLAVFGNQRLRSYSSTINIDEDITFLGSLILKEGVDIATDFVSTNFDVNVIKEVRTIMVKNHFVTDSSTASGYHDNSYKRRLFEEKFLHKFYQLSSISSAFRVHQSSFLNVNRVSNIFISHGSPSCKFSQYFQYGQDLSRLNPLWELYSFYRHHILCL